MLRDGCEEEAATPGAGEAAEGRQVDRPAAGLGRERCR
ncbi:hypothetical protein SCAB_65631 [Streptomyces scabiei 87.22]|uniref:Uncharacterized protein n=1 Tax=Streptomyces scabiei (strain 87.22) TaxID=680198 RepID=C9ZFS5_STRSW|nr:hypothetical protein SCAB_65631 [Streptomyces scabiei 87.22]